MNRKSIFIAGTEIKPGEEKQVSLSIAKLPSRTPIEVPVIVSRAKKPGPTVLFMAGMHGDEINGVEIIRRIITGKYNVPKKGTIICIPLLNVFGFIISAREVPDGKDINRSFPGSKNGSLASQVAFHLMKEIIPLIDIGVDFHTGGASRTNYPQLRCNFNMKRNISLAKAFGVPFIINSNYRPKSLRYAASRIEKPILVYEAGESLRFDEVSIKRGVNGARRLLKTLGLTDKAPARKKTSVILKETKWVRASSAGLFHALVNAGDLVKKNQKIGEITGPYGDFTKAVYSPSKAYVIGLNNNPVVNKGDALLNLGLK
ncbi:MAG: succinylglutamate desuccinylase/aspartoacylase family protein [Bacteroidia bacterium]|nr:succinylglutamate desuccinylase/aspartoacylase family protein [Bacteroidia bacterium]